MHQTGHYLKYLGLNFCAIMANCILFIVFTLKLSTSEETRLRDKEFSLSTHDGHINESPEFILSSENIL